MKKKWLSLTLALTLGLSLLTLPTMAADATVVKTLEGYKKCFDARLYSDGMIAVEKQGDDYGNTYLDRNANEIPGGPYSVVRDFSEGLAAVQPNIANWKGYKGYGYIDKTGKIVIEPQFNYAGQFHEGVARVQDNETKKWGIIDKSGNVVVPLEYDSDSNLHEPSDGLILAYDKPNGYWGYFDTKGNIAIPFQYAYANDFHAGYAKVKLGKKETFIDKTGRDILPGDHYEYVEQLKVEEELVALFSARDTAAEGRNSYYIFNGNGQVVAGPYESLGRGGYDKVFVSGLMAACKADDKGYKHGYINTAGQEVIPCGTYRPISSSAINAFVDGYALVNTQDNTRVIINTAGQITATLPQDLRYNAEKWSEGFLAVSSDESGKTRWGFISAHGQQVVPCKYNSVRAFDSGVAVVQDFASKYGLVNAAGQEIVPCKYTRIDKFTHGVAVVHTDSGYGLINTAGQEILPCVYYDTTQVKDTLQKGGKEVCVLLQRKDNNRYDFVRINSDYVTPTTPVIPTQPGAPVQPAANTAYASTQKVLVDGKAVEFQCYALKDAKGNLTNYIKLRDMASILNGTSVQFQVGWNGAVNIETGKAYTPNGSEMNTPFSGDRGYETATAATNINGSQAALEAIVLKDDQGGAYTYYKLRDLGAALGFKVDWSAEKGIFIETK